MKRSARNGPHFPPVAVLAAILPLTAEAKAPAASPLQEVARGGDGVVAAGVLCRRVHRARPCFPGTIPTCPSGGC